MRPIATAPQAQAMPSLSLGQGVADGSPKHVSTSLPSSATSANFNPSTPPLPKAVAALSQSQQSSQNAAANTLLRVKVIEKPQMSEINPGVWDGLSPEMARERYPDEWDRFLKDPYAFRAPRAESYHDLCGQCIFTIV